MKSSRDGFLKSFFDPSRAILTPSQIVRVFTRKKTIELSLPKRAVVVFDNGDLKRIMAKEETSLNQSWTPFRSLYHIKESPTVMVKSSFGGPNIASLTEELTAFGMQECVLWGYCGAIHKDMKIGDIIIVREALREEGVSHHYLDSNDDSVQSNWFEPWSAVADEYGIRPGIIWSCDAIYRETEDKISRYRAKGILGVEMEVASFYAVCRFLNVKGIAFLVVSDTFGDGSWQSGFHTKPFKEGVKRLTGFMLHEVIHKY
jgi:uridine phosphorylase